MGRRNATGDVAELDWSPSDAAWRTVSVGSDECPGADRCPMGRSAGPSSPATGPRSPTSSSSTRTSTASTSAPAAILPEHDVVVFDEAHGLEDIMSDTVGVELAPGRFVARRVVRSILDADQA